MAQQGSTRREPLGREAIVSAGVALADEAGVDALTMRNVADRLGYKVMALYNHIANKDELLEAMVDAVAGEIAEPPADGPALDAIRSHAMATRESFVRHRWAPGLWLGHLPGPNRRRHMEASLATFDRSGLSPGVAHHGFHAVNNHVLGYTLQELAMDIDLDSDEAMAAARSYVDSLPEDEFPHSVAHVHQHLEGDNASSFELVLDFILEGLVRLDAEQRGA